MAAIQFDSHQFDIKHLQGLVKSKKKLQKLFDEFYKEVARIGAATGFDDPEKEFYLKDFPQADKLIEQALAKLVAAITKNIEDGNATAWNVSDLKSDALLARVAANAAVPDEIYAKVTKASQNALHAFQSRKVNGMGLSDRVWKTQAGAREQIEMALELGLAQGKSAAALSRDVRELLNEPHKLFRRVRDKDGILRLSKAAEAYHPGQGVYRSSYKNALRMTATENNIAYRTADHEKHQQMPFVIGIEIHLSDNHPVEDICDTLQGVYPKDFKFTGWHPFCRCFTTTKLPSRAELNKWARMSDEERAAYHFEGEVNKLPKQFTDWVEDNEERITTAKSKPYFIQDNKAYVDGILGKQQATATMTNSEVQEATPAHSTSSEPAIKPNYRYASEVADTFNELNQGKTGEDNWFQNGDMTLHITNTDDNGRTFGDGGIELSQERLERVERAMEKIGRNKVSEITFEEADAMCTLWHEITHNRHNKATGGWIDGATEVEINEMELANEWVARKSLKEFYERLGVAAKDIPYPDLMVERDSTAYNTRVINYQHVINLLGLDEAEVYKSVRKFLFNNDLTDQRIGLMNGLIDGGMVNLNGMIPRKADIEDLIRLCRDDRPFSAIRKWLEKNNFIEPLADDIPDELD